DVTELFPVGQERVLIRWKTTESARLGHVNFPGRWGYSYFTRQSIERAGSAGGFAEIEMIDGQPAKPCYLEPNKNVKTIDDDEKRTASRSQELQSSCVGKGDELPVAGLNPDHYYVEQRISSAPYLVAAIDPQAENQLLGLDAAITTGKSLSQCEPVITGQQSSSQEDLRIPILVSAQAGEIDRTMTVAVAALPPEAAKQWATGSWSNADTRGIAFSDTPASVSKSYVLSNGDVWHNLRRTFTLVEDPATTDLGQIRGMDLSRYNRSNPLAYTVGADNSLTVTDKLNFVTPFFHTALNQDGGPRVWNESQFGKRETAKFTLLAVGEFDAAKINVAQESLGVSGAEGYRQPVILAGDEKSRNLVGERYLPTSSVADYAQPGPQLLIPIGALSTIYHEQANAAPISSIRVRVAGVTGNDEVSRERIRLAAQDIQQRTGLRVDIAAGSSTVDQLVQIPATKSLPALVLKEPWTKKGVSVTIVSAIDAKSLALFLLILASAVIAVSVAARATAHARRTENAVLSAVGWRPATLMKELSLEFALIGLAAGIAGALLAIPVAEQLHIGFEPNRAILAIPIAAVLCLFAGFGAALGSSRANPIAALRGEAEVSSKVRIGHAGAVSQGITMLLRRPGRLLCAVLSAAIGVMTITFVRAIEAAFKGRVIGTRLGDAVSIQT
ncbi:MAG: FtsX-like permease family protein, partial [Propionibacteriaceae bacterium]